MSENHSPQAVADHWNERYAAREAIWSGRVNSTLESTLAQLDLSPAGRSLDLGCGEGGDVLWLASRGWEAHGVDISTVAIDRARQRARERGLDRATFDAADLSAWVPTRVAARARYDLVTASFFQSAMTRDRAEILTGAAALLRAGGHLVLLSHAALPPWASSRGGRIMELPTADSEIALFSGDPTLTPIIAGVGERAATGPDGRPALLEDLVVALRRDG